MGVEGFSSYEKSVVTTFLEGSAKWISIGFIIFGLLMLWSYSKKKSSEKKLKKFVLQHRIFSFDAFVERKEGGNK